MTPPCFSHVFHPHLTLPINICGKPRSFFFCFGVWFLEN